MTLFTIILVSINSILNIYNFIFCNSIHFIVSTKEKNIKSQRIKKRESVQKNEITQCMLTPPDQAPTHRPHTHSRDTSTFTGSQLTQLSLFDHRTHHLYGRTGLYVFMALLTIFLGNYHSFHRLHRPHTHSQDSCTFTEAQRTNTSPFDYRSHPQYGWTSSKSL